MTKLTFRQQTTSTTRSLNKPGKVGNKQGGFVAMPLAGVLLMLGVGGAAVISESNRSDSDNGIVKVSVQQPQAPSKATSSVNDQVASFFEEIE